MRPSTTQLLAVARIDTELMSLRVLDMKQGLDEKEARLLLLEQELTQRCGELDAAQSALEQQQQHWQRQLHELQSSASSSEAAHLAQLRNAEAALLAREERLREAEAGLLAREEQLREAEGAWQAREREQTQRWTEIEAAWKENCEAAMAALKEKQERDQRRQARYGTRQNSDAPPLGASGGEAPPSSPQVLSGERLTSSPRPIRRPELTRASTSTVRLLRDSARRSSPTLTASVAKAPTSLKASVEKRQQSSPVRAKPSSDIWADQETSSDAEESKERIAAPVTSTPFRPSAKLNAIQAKVAARPSLTSVKTAPSAPPSSKLVQRWRDMHPDDSDTRMMSADQTGDVSASPAPQRMAMPSTKSFPSLLAGRGLAEMAARNAARSNTAAETSAVARPPLQSRRSGLANVSAENSAMSCDTFDDRSGASPFVQKVSRLDLKEHSPAQENASAPASSTASPEKPTLASARLSRMAAAAARAPSSPSAAAASRALGTAAPGAPAGRIVGRPRSSAVIQPITASRRRAAV